ncbi:hypothetical protein AMS68_005726 [Peltaster fructicola]|uniref:Histone deacetylase domain-containing protein n=1 Tax=Peltaster fructicola TaxID=286661 RepID=A0A6H0Y018_9PEZI|nr:hypothetical protein AMS68_005726 [Peltaster fructicola]
MSAQTPGMPGLAQGVSLTASSSPRPALDTHRALSSPRTAAAQLQRPGSSASPRLNRKSSRSSLGSPVTHDDNHRRPTPKRSISNLITELRGAQATMEAIPEPVILTAPEIAAECFKRELAAHDETAAETVVLLHDACYGHRFSRLKTSKSTLSMIVERPERLLASVLGIAATYVRLGGYHAGERNAPHPKHIPAQPPFAIRRTLRTLDLKSTFVTNVHGSEWMSELKGLCEIVGTRLVAGEKEVARLSSAKDKQSLHEGDLYLCQESLEAFQGALGGVADAVDAVFLPTTNARRAFAAVRPPGHHCSADYPSGFCWLNNVHVGIEYAAQLHELTHAAIIDFDLHHGDGSQSIAWQRNSRNHAKRMSTKANAKSKMSPDIGYYSLHDINSYPCEMGDDEKVQAASLCVHNAHGQSIWNVHLQPWKTIEEFWALYESQYLILLQKAEEFLEYHTARILAEGRQRPKAAIFISAGFDASEHEGEGMQRHKVNVPTDFYARFTEDIIQLAEKSGTSCAGRVISVLEGGYSDRALCSSTMSHLTALCAAQPVSAAASNGLGSSMRLNGTAEELNQHMQGLSLASHGYDSAWWSTANLNALELHVNPPPPSTAGGKKIRTGPHPTYATPTESFAYKVIDPAKFARSVSGTLREGAAPTRPTTPPPPEVDWIIAAHELSKLLTPTDRTTRSATAEDLAGPKAKKERASSAETVPFPDEPGKPRQLRTRGKVVAQTPAAPKRVVSSAVRRRTMADLPSAAAEAGPIDIQPRRASRRSSMASTVSTISVIPAEHAPPVPALPPQRPALPPSTTSEGVLVKKTRVTPSTPAAKPKKATISATPRNPSTNAVAATPTAASESHVDPGMDVLASGMKRINLKVGTREESERKAKEKLDADRRARALKGAETRRINKAAKDARAAQEKAAVATESRPATQQSMPTSTTHTMSGQSAAYGTSQEPQLQQMQQYQDARVLQGAAYGTAQASQLQQATPFQDAVLLQAASSHHQSADGHPAEHHIPSYTSYDGAYDRRSYLQHNPVPHEHNIMTTQHQANHQPGTNPAYTSYQSTAPSSHILPVFSSTGHIPFAQPNNMAPQAQQHGQATNLQYPIDAGAQPDSATYAVNGQHMRPMQQTEDYGQAEMQSRHAYDVWAVPDTPSKEFFNPQR